MSHLSQSKLGTGKIVIIEIKKRLPTIPGHFGSQRQRPRPRQSWHHPACSARPGHTHEPGT